MLDEEDRAGNFSLDDGTPMPGMAFMDEQGGGSMIRVGEVDEHLHMGDDGLVHRSAVPDRTFIRSVIPYRLPPAHTTRADSDAATPEFDESVSYTHLTLPTIPLV